MTNLDSIFKHRDITLPTKVCLVKAMVFPVVMFECESWTVKKAECRRINAFAREMVIRALKTSTARQRGVEVLGEGVGPIAVHRMRSISDMVHRSGGRRVPDALEGCGAD